MDDLGAPQSPNPSNITDLLRARRLGDERATEELAPLVYATLHQIAHRQLMRENPGQTLQTTGLVHEAFAKFVGLDRIELSDRTHFFALCARLMRQVLTDHAKRRLASKRLAVGTPEDYHGGAAAQDGEALLVDLIALDRALEKLAAMSERQTRVIECRFFSGMSVEETAEALAVSKATVKRDWQMARAWLNREMA